MSDYNAHEQLTQSGDSRAALLAAATLARDWVRAQRQARNDELPTMATIGAQGRPVQAAAPPAPVQPPPVPVPPPVAVAPPVPVSPPVVVASPPPPPAPVVTEALVPVEIPEPAPLPVPFEEAASLPAPAVEEIEFEEEEAVPVPARQRAPMSFAWVPKLAMAAGVVVALAGGGWLASRLYSKASVAAPTKGTAVLESSPDAALVLIDGAEIGKTPLTHELAAGQHSVEFRQGKNSRTYQIEVAAGQQVVSRVDWNARRTGTLQIESTPTGAKVLIDGRDHGATPLTVRDLAVGTHALTLQSPEGTVRRSIKIAEDQTLQVSEALFSGFLHVSSSIELQISEGRQVIRLDDRNQALLSPGTHQVRFANRALGFSETRKIEIKPGELTSITIEPTMSSISVVSTIPGEVFIDGLSVGQTPLTNHQVAVGTREVVVRTPEGEKKTTVSVQADQPAEVSVDFGTP